MAQRRTNVIAEKELLALARSRVDLPAGEMWFDYQDDVDLLYVKMKTDPRPTRTADDMERGVIFHYEGDELVSVEILDLYGTFAS